MNFQKTLSLISFRSCIMKLKLVRTIFYILFALWFQWGIAQSFNVLDSENLQPIPFATISFGNGYGNFADENGQFTFRKENYKAIDTLFISAMGYAEQIILINAIPKKILLEPTVSELDEVIISAKKLEKFKRHKLKAITHLDIFTSWLPTVESEVAILFKRQQKQPTQITKLLLPINAESKYKTKGKGNYATIFRINFYQNLNGLPGDPMGYENVVFHMNEKEDKVFELDITTKSIFIPEKGIFVALQVLGYADSNGKLAQTKQYREIKTRLGIQKIATSFRPLLPFTDKLKDQNTYVRRIFFNDKKWQIFDKSYNKKSKLIQTGHRNYGMGAAFRVYKN